MTLEVPEVTALDPGIYPAKVTGLETKTTDAGTFRIWAFEVQANGETQKITASSSMMFGPKSKTFKWVTVLIGRSPVPGEKLEVVGLTCQLHLIIDEDSGYNRVEAVLPSVNGARRVSPTTSSVASPSATADTFSDGVPLEEPPVVNQNEESFPG